MEWLKPFKAVFASWWAYIDFCVEADIRAAVCKPFWNWVMIALFAVGAIIIAWLAFRIVSYRLKLRAALRAEAERAGIADEDTMREHVWDGDKAYQTDQSSEDIQRRIKEALIARKSDGRVPPVV